MSQLLKLIFSLSWLAGVLSIIAAIVIKLLTLEQRVRVTGHTLFLMASAFFLCALATREMERRS
jgi:multidrug transporter EmrE-like cation transporter